MNFCSLEYDMRLWRSEKHFVNFPQMLPYIGTKWNEVKQKILVLGESHFQPEGCAERDAADWYLLTSNRLYVAEIESSYTRNAVLKCCFLENRHRFFTAIASELSAHFACSRTECFQNISFFNYFQRPAATGKSLKPTSLDQEVAYRVLKAVTEIINPEKIIFASGNAAISFYYSRSKATDANVFQNILIDYTVHPCCSWWNRPLRRLGERTGKQKFIDVLNRPTHDFKGIPTVTR